MAAFSDFVGKSVTLTEPWVLISWARAAQCALTGHLEQLGLVFGTHTVAPSSITAWLKSPGLAGSTKESASEAYCLAAAAALGSATASARSLESTLTTLPSTTATLRPQAIDAMAAEVYAPTPGIFCSPASSLGNSPPSSSATYLAPLSRNAALR